VLRPDDREEERKQSRPHHTQSNSSPEFNSSHALPEMNPRREGTMSAKTWRPERGEKTIKTKTKHSPTFRRNSSSLVMNPSTRRNNECQDLTTRKEDSQDAAYKGGTPSESSMSSAQMNPSRYQQEVNVKTSRNGGTEEKREGGANGRKTKRQEKRMNRLRQ